MENSQPNNSLGWLDKTDTQTVDPKYYFYLLRSQWKILLAAAVTAAIIGFVISLLSTRVYRSTTTLLVNSGGATEGTDFNILRTNELLARTYVELLESRAVLQPAIDEFGLTGLTVGQLKGKISAAPVTGTQLIRVQVDDTDPERAASIANAATQSLITYLFNEETAPYTQSEANLEARLTTFDNQIADIQSQLDELGPSASLEDRGRLDRILSDANAARTVILQEYEDIRVKKNEAVSNIQQIEEATPSRTPIRPRTFQNVISGLLLGLVVAVALVLGRELVDDTIRDPERLSEQIGIPILGRVLNFDAENERLITIHKPRSPQAENFRSIRLNLDYVSPDKPIRSVLVTSAAPSEGKSTLSSNLAIVMAQGGKKTVLIDGDMRRPKVHRIFDVQNIEGLSNLFLPSANGSRSTFAPTAVENLFVIPSGPLPPNPSELFYSERAGDIIGNTADDVDMLIVDTPPIATMTDAAAIARHVDGVILAVRFGQTKRRVLDQALEALEQVGARIVGLVITDVGNRDNRYGYYYYNYRYEYSGYSTYYGDEEQEKQGSRRLLKGRKKQTSKST